MKKKILLFTLSSIMGAVVLMSNGGGAVNGGNGIRNGAKGITQTCAQAGCHTGTLAAIPGIRVDSVGGVEVTSYVAGMTYTVTVTGSHPTNTKFGFQLAAVSGTGTAQVQAGSFAATGLPAQTAKRTSSSLEIMEHSSVITGTGTPATLSKSFVWTAPTSTTLTDVKFYLAVNAVNGNGVADAGDAAENLTITLPRQIPSTEVADIANNATVIAYPNPTTGILNINASAWTNATVNVYDIAGRNVASVQTNSVTGAATINTDNWASGVYNVVVSNETGRKAIQVVKQ